MTRHRWIYIGTTNEARVFVDYGQRKTKIDGLKFIYIHNGIYPYHNPEYNRRFSKK